MLRAPFDRAAVAALPCLLAACAGGRSVPLPQSPGWVGGQRIAVEGPGDVGIGGPELAAGSLHEAVEGDLRSAGFAVVPAAEADDLRLVLVSFERALVRAEFRRGAREVERFEISSEPLSCVSGAWGLYPRQNAECFGRALVTRVLQSDRVAQAAAGAPQGAKAAPALALELPPEPVEPKPDRRALLQQEAAQRAAAQREAQAAREPEPEPRQQAQAQQPSSRRVIVLHGKLAVLDLKNYTKDLDKQNAQYFTDVIRQATLRLEPGLDIMTRENLLVLLQATGKKLEECEGECEVDTGRRIGADNIISGELQKVGTHFKLTLRLHDTRDGRLLASAIGSGKSIDELDESAQKAAEELFAAR